MVEVDIPERTYVVLELLALAESTTPASLLDKMIFEYRTAHERELILDSARKTKRGQA